MGIWVHNNEGKKKDCTHTRMCKDAILTPKTL